MLCHTADIAVNGHFVIVQNNNHGLFAYSGIVQSFVSHTAGCGAVANQSNHMIIFVLQGSCTGHT